jgi:hypothetical protein
VWREVDVLAATESAHAVVPTAVPHATGRVSLSQPQKWLHFGSWRKYITCLRIARSWYARVVGRHDHVVAVWASPGRAASMPAREELEHEVRPPRAAGVAIAVGGPGRPEEDGLHAAA